MGAVFEINDPAAEDVIEKMRIKLSEVFGVSVQGNHVTVRWGKPLQQVTMVVTEVDTEEERNEMKAKGKRMQALEAEVKKVTKGKIDLAAELCYVEEGEYPQ